MVPNSTYLPLVTRIARFDRGLLPVLFAALAAENYQPENEHDCYD